MGLRGVLLHESRSLSAAHRQAVEAGALLQGLLRRLDIFGLAAPQACRAGCCKARP